MNYFCMEWPSALRARRETRRVRAALHPVREAEQRARAVAIRRRARAESAAVLRRLRGCSHRAARLPDAVRAARLRGTVWVSPPERGEGAVWR